MRYFTCNGTVQCRNSYLNILPPYDIESNLDRLGLLSPTHGQRSRQPGGQITHQSVLINKPKFLKATHRTKIRKIEIPRFMMVEALAGEAGSGASIRSSKALCISEKAPQSLIVRRSLSVLVGRKQTVVRDQIFPQKPPGSRL